MTARLGDDAERPVGAASLSRRKRQAHRIEEAPTGGDIDLGVESLRALGAGRDRRVKRFLADVARIVEDDLGGESALSRALGDPGRRRS
jgi:hypothetical protein